jgi:hypothetical protein
MAGRLKLVAETGEQCCCIKVATDMKRELLSSDIERNVYSATHDFAMKSRQHERVRLEEIQKELGVVVIAKVSVVPRVGIGATEGIEDYPCRPSDLISPKRFFLKHWNEGTPKIGKRELVGAAERVRCTGNDESGGAERASWGCCSCLSE